MSMEPAINQHNKQEYPPMHTAEHILNATMVRMVGCGRHVSAHVERTKSKLDYDLPQPLTEQQVRDIEQQVNQVIQADLPVTVEFALQADVAQRFNLERLPDDATQTVRIVHVGDYDECLCAGNHVEHTAQIGQFRITSTRWQDGRQRIVFRLAEAPN